VPSRDVQNRICCAGSVSAAVVRPAALETAGVATDAVGRPSRGRAAARPLVDPADELVAASVDGTDESPGAAVIADRLPRRLDSAGQRRLGDEAIAPDRVQQLALGHDTVSLPNEHGEHVEHLRLDWLDLATAPKLVSVEIEFAAVEVEDQIPTRTRSPRCLHVPSEYPLGG